MDAGDTSSTNVYEGEPGGQTRGASRRRLIRTASALVSSAGLMLAVGGAVIVATGRAEEEAQRTGTPTASPTATATPTVPPATPFVLDEQPLPEPKTKTTPLGPIEAERAVVYTGDGDCLNVRPVPSKQFESDPRFCLNEGEVVYLHGDPIEADGETWRYALGRGWLATRYVKMEPSGGPADWGGLEAVLLRSLEGWVGGTGEGVRLDASGKMTELPALRGANGQPGEGVTFSRDGQYAAYTLYGPVPVVHIVDLERGTEQVVERAVAVNWSVDGKLLLTAGGCDQRCERFASWIRPGDAEPRPLGLEGEEWVAMVWAPDGESVIASPPGRVLRLWLDGSVDVLVEQLPEGVGFWEMSVSPDGGRLLGGGIAGPLPMLDLETGALSWFERAPQPVQPGGSCGGSIGKLSDWLSNDRIVYHESYAAKGQNGITIGDVRSGQRQVLSFWNIADLETVGPELVTFTSFEQINDLFFQLTWLLDTRTGEARPVAVGTGEGWVR